jgi:hypothetical protein
MRSIFGIAVLVLAGNVHAAIVTLDFEDLALGTSPAISNGFIVDGFSGGLEPVPAGFVDDRGAGNHAVFGVVGGGPEFGFTNLSLRATDDSPFALYQFDFGGTGTAGLYTVTGHTTSGADITWFTGDPSPFGSGDWLSLEFVSFYGIDPVGFGGALWVDNIQVQAVPVPAAVWLFGSGLGLLGWIRRRKTA